MTYVMKQLTSAHEKNVAGTVKKKMQKAVDVMETDKAPDLDGLMAEYLKRGK